MREDGVSAYVWNQCNQDPTPITIAANGDWRIYLAALHAEIVLPKARRAALVHAITRLYVEWVVDGKVYEVSHRNDPPWDYSGETLERPTTERERLGLYHTLGE